jgi:peroxiredoxin
MAQVPDFTLTDQAGNPWTQSDARANGAIVLVFYRGDW